MIRIKRIYKKKSNPYISDYGYHLTNSKNLNSILKKGLIPGFIEKNYSAAGSFGQISRYFYNNKQPIYFLDILDLNKIPETLRKHFENSNYNIALKVDVSKFNQSPDINMLVIDYDFQVIGGFGNSLLFSRNEFKNIKSLNKILQKYDFDIPFTELKNNEELQTELIFLTNTFTINQKIDPKYIEEVIKL